MRKLGLALAGVAMMATLSACGPKDVDTTSAMPDMTAEEHAKMGAPAQVAEVTNATCPVEQGEAVNPAIKTTHEGRTVYFCCQDCVPKFKQDPEKYLARLDQPATAPAADDHAGHDHPPHDM